MRVPTETVVTRTIFALGMCGLLWIDPQLELVLAGELVAFAGVLRLDANGELQSAGGLGNKRAAAADLERLPLFADAGAQRTAGNLVGNVPAVLGHAIRAGMGVAAPGGHDDGAFGLDDDFVASLDLDAAALEAALGEGVASHGHVFLIGLSGTRFALRPGNIPQSDLERAVF